MDGIFLLDKPAGISSAGALNKIKYAHKPSRIGHAGTLDPMATGLLVVLLGKATKLQSIYMDGEKSYRGVILLGTRTDTDDITGAVIEQDADLEAKLGTVLDESLQKILTQFSGNISQHPPIVSALKHKGEAAYKRVRRGETVETTARTVHVQFETLNFLSPRRLEYSVVCSKGTYIRSLARDIGEALGTCGTLESIRRERVGALSISESHGLELALGPDFKHLCKPLCSSTVDLPSFRVSAQEYQELMLGRQAVLQNRSSEFKEKTDLAVLELENTSICGLIQRNDTNDWSIRCML